MVTEDEKAAIAKITVELNEDLIGGRVDSILGGASTELANLRWALVWTIPVETRPSTEDKEKRELKKSLEIEHKNIALFPHC